MNLNNQKRAFLLLSLPFLLFTCGGGSDDPIPEPPEPPVITEGNVTITPQMSDDPLPALQYHFYNTDGKTACKVLACDGKGNFSGKLPLGSYRVIAANTSASGVVFKDMDSYTGASVHLSPVPPNRSQGYTMVNQPGKVYAVAVDNVNISEAENGTQKPTAVALTKSIQLPFTLENGLETDVTAIEGVLHGVYPSVSLFTCTPASTVQASSEVAVRFAATGSGADRAANISLFGICDPKGGEAYTNTLTLILTMSNGEKEELSIDLTNALSEALAGNAGVLPSDLKLPVQMNRTAIGLGATVSGWTIGGESEKEMQN